MNLPFVLDVAIGLIFIYLILSLLASEIQEIINTLLQWRAVHLKKSIEILLTGGEGTPKGQEIKSIVDDLYDNPLIKNINQEAKEGLAAWMRQITWGIGKAYRQLRGKDVTAFDGKRSAPSYIPAETFSSTLLERLGIAQISHNLTTYNLKNLKDKEIVQEIKDLIVENIQISEDAIAKANNEITSLDKNLNKIFESFKHKKITLPTSVQRIKFELELFIGNLKTYYNRMEDEGLANFIRQIEFLKANIFPETENATELIERLQPSLDQILNQLERASKVWKQYQSIKEDKDSEIYKAFQEIDSDIKNVIQTLPPQLVDSLAALSRRAQIKVTDVEQDLNQFKKEIEIWFDHSMERASGVYKRNAKGVAFLIGFFLAFAANADSLHIISRLSKDTTLRSAITQSASGALDSASQNCSESYLSGEESTDNPPSRLNCLRKEVNLTLEQMPLPIGWNRANLTQQQRAGWQIQNLSFYPLRMFLGWLISGFAISMGASFWFELLGKIINVRNTGARPKSSTSRDN